MAAHRRIAAVLAACTLGLGLVGGTVSAARPALPVGEPCPEAGQTLDYRGTWLICRKKGARLVWARQVTSQPQAATRKGPDRLADDDERFARRLPRTTIDRPDDGGESGPKIKVIYAVPSFARDRRRDVTGEIARGLFQTEEWRALQNGGFGLRYDTFNGALDIGFMAFESTKEEWYARFQDVRPFPGFQNGLSHFQVDLQRAGWWTGPLVADGNDTAAIEAAKTGDLFFVVFEAPAGTYGRTGAGAGGCRSMIDAVNDRIPIIGWASIDDAGGQCDRVDAGGRFNAAASPVAQNYWIAQKYGMIDHVHQWMRNLPGCGPAMTPRSGEPVKIPGVLDESRAWEIRGGFNRDLSEVNDPNSGKVVERRPIAVPPVLDPRHDLYFHITSDKLASAGQCNGDISRHPLWDMLPLDRASGRTLLRSSYDRPDDAVGPQVHAVYAVRNGAADRMLDTSGDIERALRHADSWLRAETGKGLRFDTYRGRADVTYLPLPRGFEQSTGRDCSTIPCPDDRSMLALLASIGRVDPEKTYVFFYSGGLTDYVLCGGAGVGTSVLLNLEVDGRSCAGADWTEPRPTALQWSLLMVHELLHLLGAVCETAPDWDGSVHSRRTDDIMNGRAKGAVRIDPERRNYWGNVPPGCTDASRSPLFTG